MDIRRAPRLAFVTLAVAGLLVPLGAALAVGSRDVIAIQGRLSTPASAP